MAVRLKARTLISMATLVAMAGLWPAGGRADDRLPESNTVDSTNALDLFSKASEALCKKISTSIVRVKTDQLGLNVPASVLRDFDGWRREPSATAAAATMPSRGVTGPGRMAMFRKFLELKIDTTLDPDMKARLRAIQARLDPTKPGQAGASEAIAVVLDDQGHVLLAGSWIREGQAGTCQVTASDGTQLTAKCLGMHLGRGFTVLKLESPGVTTGAGIAEKKPVPGELLMSMVSHTGAITWVTAPEPPAGTVKKNADWRFAIIGPEDRMASYLFNIKGELAAIGQDRNALPLEGLKHDIQWIIDNNRDIAPRRLGVAYKPLAPEVRRATAGLGNRAAVVVDEVTPDSPAEKAGLKKGDIVLTIDGKSIWQLPEIQMDLATRTGSIPMGILRGGKDVTLDLPLGD